MDKISLIIPFTHGTVNIRTFIAKLNKALSVINAKKRSAINDYEIIFITNNTHSISLQDIEIYPYNAPINIYMERDAKGVSGLIMKGMSLARYEIIGILDPDANYTTHVLKTIIRGLQADDSDVVAAFKTLSKAKKKSTTAKAFQPITNNFLFKLSANPQAGTLFFTKTVWETIRFSRTTDTSFFLDFLNRAQNAGFSLKEYDIYASANDQETETRMSPRKFVNAARGVISMKMRDIPPITIKSRDSSTMINAGVRYRKHKYITHTTLNTKQSALAVFEPKHIFVLGIILELIAIGLVLNWLLFVQFFVAVLSATYLLDVLFNVFLVFRSLRGSGEIRPAKEEIAELRDEDLPIYTILCPLYKEAHMLPQFLAGISDLDWPKEKLDVQLLIEADDTESIEAIKEMNLPTYIRSIIVPYSMPKTKPKACNYGLGFARGEFTVIFDAEDIPDPLQLKKAYIGFQQLDREVVCLQAKLSYYNANQNLLTRFFTAEYSLWFGMILTGLMSLETTIPLGGTSNHFRTEDLQKLHAWDPFNVTEDADLGMRIFKLGYRTAILDSVTLEEGNSNVKNWIRQRSRWIKGYMQTYIVHTKEGFPFSLKNIYHAFIFHLIIGGKISFIFINPLLWFVTILYFTMYSFIGPTIDQIYPQPILYVAITSLIFGNYLYFFCYIMGCVKKEQWGLIKYILLIPAYWVLISIAGIMALYQLIFKPFYWEKTVHGLHLKNKDKSNMPVQTMIPNEIPASPSL